MTVCVAAICQDGIIGASDRMLTAGDIEFEPLQPKIINLTTSIFIMVAGDSSLQSELIDCVRKDVNQRITSNPDNWWNVKDVADIYNQYYNYTRFKKAENQILSPLGLDNNSFINRQHEMDSSLVMQLSREMINFDLPATQAIFAGVDTSGPHLYVSNNGIISCQDIVGFASIGVGAWHANSQMMFSGHAKWKLLPETLLLVYSSKKRAEVAPGVGEATDMVKVGPALGTFFYIGDHVLKRLAEIYNSEREKEIKSINESKESINHYVEDITRTSAKEQASVPQDTSGEDVSEKKEKIEIDNK
ncbi:MAG: hypothetical protein PHD40_09725 [Syntrophomonadaceae bacterium]|nr:hypothetical protein [Syntrophomonadaceae bacterium]